MKSHYIVPLLIAVTLAAIPFRKYSCHIQTAGLGLVPENDLLVTDHNNDRVEHRIIYNDCTKIIE
jgi:hypothetical protein